MRLHFHSKILVGHILIDLFPSLEVNVRSHHNFLRKPHLLVLYLFVQEEVVAACKAANAHEFILEMEEGYETRVGEKGRQTDRTGTVAGRGFETEMMYVSRCFGD